MEALTDPKYGITGIVVFLALNLLVEIGKLTVKLFQKKTANDGLHITKIDLTLTQINESVRDLRVQIGILERELGEVHKLNADIQKLFSAVKFMAGKKWPTVRKALEEDGLPK